MHLTWSAVQLFIQTEAFSLESLRGLSNNNYMFCDFFLARVIFALRQKICRIVKQNPFSCISWFLGEFWGCSYLWHILFETIFSYKSKTMQNIRFSWLSAALKSSIIYSFVVTFYGFSTFIERFLEHLLSIYFFRAFILYMTGSMYLHCNLKNPC